ncbi:MAG: hypothetical protein HC921_04995 [Synechococcaceae cyanobacterium SM2_3_1]|nr:hypothetical protein [Synechococcaceae cyanobacterium SM2_3_1]
MPPETITFKLSDQFHRERRKRFLLTFIVFLGFFAIWIVWNRSLVMERLSQISPGLVGLFVFALICFGVARRRWTHRYLHSRSQLHLTKEGLTWGHLGAAPELPWSEITKVRIWNTRQGEVRCIQIHSQKRPSMILVGFDSIQEMATQIRSSLATHVDISSRILRIDWFGPYALAVLVAIYSTLVLLLQYFWGVSAIRYLWVLVSLLFSALFLARRPVSRSNPKLVAIDILLGVFFLLRAVRWLNLNL